MRTQSRTGESGVDECGVGDGVIGRIAARQRGIVARSQLLDAGLSRDAIGRRLRAGRLHSIHRGVYAVGHAVLVSGARELAAVLACGPGAVVSHASAARLFKLLPHPAQPGPVHVTVVERDCGHVKGITIHRVRSMGPDEVGTLAGIPITSPARTILDLAATDKQTLEQALAEAHAQRLEPRARLLPLLDRYPRRRGMRTLRALLADDDGARLTRSEAERRFLRLVRRARLPAPETNVRLGAYEVDFLWRDQRLVVEVDGYWFHSSRQAFERDRAKEAELRNRGLRLRRFSWRQVTADPEATIADLARELGPATRSARLAR
jgi:very-short-patch-repair endonuclease